ncbi:MAG TPA: GNAT family N-acetyltransferase [Tenuifilaceae bacterium]|nr:GNAT family N-acetyltransferase [Tenuifilaceae bacterium]
MVNVRRATLSDLESVYQVICDLEGCQLNFELFSDTFSANLSDDNIIYLIAEINNSVVGFLSMHIQRILHHEKPTCELQELNVLSEFRSKGIGSTLMHEAEKIALQNNLEEVELTTKIYRKQAQEFYIHLGFENTHLKFVKRLPTNNGSTST